jgi:hypothetical protein
MVAKIACRPRVACSSRDQEPQPGRSKSGLDLSHASMQRHSRTSSPYIPLELQLNMSTTSATVPPGEPAQTTPIELIQIPSPPSPAQAATLSGSLSYSGPALRVVTSVPHSLSYEERITDLLCQNIKPLNIITALLTVVAMVYEIKSYLEPKLANELMRRESCRQHPVRATCVATFARVLILR